MYQVEAWSSLRRASRAASGRLTLRPAVATNVLALGVTSLLTDVSTEMVNTVLPAYLVLHLGLTPFSWGLVDGIAQGVTVLSHLATGIAADRYHRCKEIAGAGYAVSALSRLALVLTGTAWSPIAASVAADRLGKGIRTVPRDLLISLSTPRDEQATAFGVHRALDSAGAMMGPLAALAILAAIPAGFDVVFVASFCVALCGVAALALFVTNVPVASDLSPRPAAAPRARVRAALATPGLRRLVIVVLVLGAATIGDAFLYLALQRQVGFNAGLLPLLYVGTASSYLLLSLPAGRLADALGRRAVFTAGYVCLGGAYVATLLAGAGGWPHIAVTLLLLGAYYAATDGVLMAIAGILCPPWLRGSGMAVLTSATGIGRMMAALAFGATWTLVPTAAALSLFIGALAIGIVAAALLLRGVPDVARAEQRRDGDRER